jgi:hypothetical protein
MDKKITRRVVLGTAFAALAAGPFAIMALRKGEGLPDDFFSAQWKKHQKIINSREYVRGDSMVGSPGLVLNTSPSQSGVKMTAMTTISGDGGFCDIRCTLSRPDVFTYVTGEVQVSTVEDSVLNRGLPVIHGATSDTVVFVRTQEEGSVAESSLPSFSFAVRDYKRFPFSGGVVGEHEMPHDASGIAGTVLPMGFPPEGYFRRGVEWQDGTWTNSYDIPLQFGVISAGRLGNKDVLLVEGKAVLSPISFQRHLQAKLQTERRGKWKHI